MLALCPEGESRPEGDTKADLRAVLPARYRMSSSRDFAVAVKSGRRAGRTALVVHLAAARAEASRVSGTDPVMWGGPRVGLVVSKAVGNAVTRHSVARRLRAAAGTVVDEVDPQALIVIRALRPAADVGATELAAQLRSGLRKLGAL